jgi:exosortase
MINSRKMDSFTTSPSPGSEGTDRAVAPAVPRTDFPYIQLAWFSGLLLIVFLPVLTVMVKEWAILEEMGHGFFVPLVAGYIVWTDRKRILAQPVKPYYPAIVLIIWGFFQMVLGFLGADFFVARTAFLISLIGVIWTLAGWAVLRALFFPLLLLLFMIRIPLFVYQQMTFPLQIIASKLATVFLDTIGIPVLRDGNVLELPSQKLQVIEACSGIRSLLSLSFLSLAYSYFFDKRAWMRPVLFVATIPIAIGANAIRVTMTGVLSEINKDLAEGFLHTFEGWLLFMVALMGLIATHRLICRFRRPVDA